MSLNVQVEKTSELGRKLKITVGAAQVLRHFESELTQVQRTAKIKGFRPGHVPLSVVRQYYGKDIKSRVWHAVVDESFQQAVIEQELKPVGRPAVEDHAHEDGHEITEGQDFTYVASVEIMPKIELKKYKGFKLTKDPVVITQPEVDKVIEHLRNHKATLVPVEGEGSRAIQKGDFVDFEFKGALVTEHGLEPRKEMEGSRVSEIGGSDLIPGFGDELVGLRAGSQKTFQVQFPEDFGDKDYANKKAEFSVIVHDFKEKKLPELNDEFAKEHGAESLADLHERARQSLLSEKEQASNRKLRNGLLTQLIESNPFALPEALVTAQMRMLAEEMIQAMKREKLSETAMSELLGSEKENLRKRAENQVRAGLLLQLIADTEKIEVPPEELEREFSGMAQSMQIAEANLREFYQKNPDRLENLQFRMREDRTVKFVLECSKIS